MQSPACLHIPELKRGEFAAVLWEQNVGYELDWAINLESDESVATWSVLEESQTSWLSVQVNGDTWLSLQGQVEAPWLPLYRGPGPIPNVEAVPDPACPSEHAYQGIEIPADATTARFRVRSYVGDQYSPYVESEIHRFEIASGPEISGVAELSLTAGQEYAVQINLRDVPDFVDGVVTVTYPSQQLQLLDSFLNQPDGKTDLGAYDYVPVVEEVAREPGRFQFRCLHTIPEDIALTGLAVCIRFAALTDSVATVVLE
jgi:hypothetical protein